MTQKTLFRETIELSQLRLMPLTEAATPGAPRRVSGVGITTDPNRNGRVYPAETLIVAVAEAQRRLANGDYLFGQVDHPDYDEMPSLKHSCVSWDKISFDGTQVLIEGVIIANRAGQDLLALLEAGVMPRLSQRGYGSGEWVNVGETHIERITSLVIDGYDFVISPSDYSAGVSKFEHKEQAMSNTPAPIDGATTTTPPTLTLEQLKQQYGDLVAQVLHEEQMKREAETKAQVEAQAKIQAEKDELERQWREAAGVDSEADLAKALSEQKAKITQIAEAELNEAIKATVNEYADKLKYEAEFKKQFIEGTLALKPKSLDEAKQMLTTQQKTFDAFAAAATLAAKGFKPMGSTMQTNDVMEMELGLPSYAAFAAQLLEHESMRVGGKPFSLKQRPRNKNEAFTQKILKAYLEQNEQDLLDEQRRWNEAVQTSNLLMPFNVNFTVLAQALPMLVASTVFNFDTMPDVTMSLLYETFAGESGAYPTVTSASVTASHNTYVDMTGASLNGDVVVKDSTDVTTYEEGTDYMVDYVDGKINALSTGAITDGQTLHVSYTYSAIRKGEMATVEEAGISLGRVTLTAAADSLATTLSNEALIVPRTNINYDALSAVINSLTKRLAIHIDGRIFNTALSAVRGVTSNNGGTWSKSTNTLAQLVEYIGNAEVKVTNRYCMPGYIVASATNAKTLTRWEGFTAASLRPGDGLTATGELGTLGGKTVVTTTELTDGFILVVDPNLIYHRVYKPMRLDGPHQVTDTSTGKLIRAKKWYLEEFNATAAPVPGKGAYVKVTT